MMMRMRPKDVVREIFFRAQRFRSGFYSHCFGFDHFSIHLNCPFFDCSLGGTAGYFLVFSKWYPYKSNKNVSWLKPQSDPPK